MGRRGVNFNYAVRNEMAGTFVNHCGDSVNNGAEYPIGVDDAATEIYIVNSITRGCGKGMVGKTGPDRSLPIITWTTPCMIVTPT